MKTERLYVAGPMRGQPNFNFPTFDHVTNWLRDHHYEVFNPAEQDRIRGFDPTDLLGTDAELEAIGFDLASAMRDDLRWITTHATGVVMLPGWEISGNARFERSVAEKCGLVVYEWGVNSIRAARSPVPVGSRTALPFVPPTPIEYHDPSRLTALLGEETVRALDAERRVTNPTTGGQKGTKPERYDLVPVGPMAELARVYNMGAEKYEAHNWRKGYAWSLSYSAAMRHLTAFWSGETDDPESGLNHLGHVMFHCCSMIEWAATHPEMDDRPTWIDL